MDHMSSLVWLDLCFLMMETFCHVQSKLMHKLEMSITERDNEVTAPVDDGKDQRLIIDAMTFVHKLNTKPIKTCEPFASEFVKTAPGKIMRKLISLLTTMMLNNH